MKKRVIALMLGAVLIPAAVIAGGQYGHEHRAERMAEHLQLNEQQQAQLKDILASQREGHMALRQQTDEKIQAILTEEQRATWAKHREERGRFCGKHREGGHGEGHRHGMEQQGQGDA